MPNSSSSSFLLAAMHLHWGEAELAVRNELGFEKANEFHRLIDEASGLLAESLDPHRSDSPKTAAAH